MNNKVELKELLEFANINNLSDVIIYAINQPELFISFDKNGSISNMEDVIDLIKDDTLFDLSQINNKKYLIVYHNETCEFKNCININDLLINKQSIKFIYNSNYTNEIFDKIYDFKVGLL